MITREWDSEIPSRAAISACDSSPDVEQGDRLALVLAELHEGPPAALDLLAQRGALARGTPSTEARGPPCKFVSLRPPHRGPLLPAQPRARIARDWRA